MDRAARLRVTLLGGFRVSRGDTALPVPGARLRGLLVRLALAGGRAVEPGVLVDAVWSEEPPAGPAHALQTLVSRLRRAVGSAGDVAWAAGGYRLAVEAADVDALHFDRLAAAGRERLRAGDAEAATAALGEAVAVWADDPGAEPAAVAAVAPAVATRLAHVSVEAVADLAEAESSLGRTEAAAARLAGLLAAHPVHERAAALLMDALAARGRQAEALAVYERVREDLAEALGADPGAALRERHLRLLRPGRPVPAAAPAAPRTPAGDAGAAPAAARTVDAGEGTTGRTGVGGHTLPAAGRPTTTGPDGARQADLPVPLSSFVGRAGDLARIDALLAAGRLVTVVGPGGAGKTRLAVEAARRHRHGHRDGARFVDLAAVTEPAEITAAVLAGVGPRSGGGMLDGRRRGEEEAVDVLVDRLGGRESLLLVDNCEHLIDAVARLVAALLARCPGLRVLATSREPLAVDGEALVPLGPLPLPGPDDGVEEAGRAAAVRLFCERAAAVRPGFAVDTATVGGIVRVVRGLDGMPLALELAAARLRSLPLADLVEGLSAPFRLLATGRRAAPRRHRTLRAVIAWSWQLLDDDERVVAERVSVLPGGITAGSAAAVCAGTGVPAGHVPEVLAGLADRSLVQLVPETGRYRMLETIREYGVERLLEAGGLDDARDRAARHFTELMARHDPELRGPGQLAAMEVIGAEYDNTIAALRHLCARGDADGAVVLALHLTWYWPMSGRQSDAAHWLGEALAVPGGAATPERDCARAVHLLNRMDVLAGVTPGRAADDREEVRELAHRLPGRPELPGHHRVFGPILLFLLGEQSASAVFRTLADGDDAWLSGLAHMFLAELAENAGALDRARVHVEAALTGFRRAGDRWGQATVVSVRSRLRRYDDLDGALDDLRTARRLADEFGSLSPGDQLYNDLRRVDVHLRRGDTDRATALLGEARERALRAPSTEMPALVDVAEAEVRVRLGDLDRAGALLDGAERALHGDTAFPAEQARASAGGARAALCVALGDLPGAERALRRAYAAARATAELPVLAQVAVHGAALAEARGRHRAAAVLLGAASRLRGAHDRTDPRVCALTRRGRAALGGAEFAAAYAEGRGLDGEQAVAAADPARQPSGPAPRPGAADR